MVVLGWLEAAHTVAVPALCPVCPHAHRWSLFHALLWPSLGRAVPCGAVPCGAIYCPCQELAPKLPFFGQPAPWLLMDSQMEKLLSSTMCHLE